MDSRARAVARSLWTVYAAGSGLLGAVAVVVCFVVVPVAGVTLVVLAPLLGLGFVRAQRAWRCRDVGTEAAAGMHDLERWLRRQPRPR